MRLSFSATDGKDWVYHILQQLGDDGKVSQVLAKCPKLWEFFIYLFSETNARRIQEQYKSNWRAFNPEERLHMPAAYTGTDEDIKDCLAHIRYYEQLALQGIYPTAFKASHGAKLCSSLFMFI